METFLEHFGYLGLLAVSFLSATLVPLTSEVAVVGMLAMGFNVWVVMVTAIAGSFLGSLSNYMVGREGTRFVLARFMRFEPRRLAQAERFFGRWGPVALFFSWVPLIGDPLTLVAGAVNVDLRAFIFWVLAGKTVRILIVVGLALHVFSWPWIN